MRTVMREAMAEQGIWLQHDTGMGSLRYVAIEPLCQFRQRLSTVRDFVLLRFGHFGVGLSLVLEARIPAC